jgi:hypothetical protein
VSKEGPGLALSDAKGELRAGLAVVKDEPALGLGDATGKTSAGLIVTKDGPALRLDTNGKPRVGLGVGKFRAVAANHCPAEKW